MKERKDILAVILYYIVRYQTGGNNLAYVHVQYPNPIKCVFICINLNWLLKEHMYINICCVLNRLILLMYAFNE